MSKFERFQLLNIGTIPLQQSNKMSSVTFSFNPSSIHPQFRAAFMARFTEMVMEYEALIQYVPISPPADAVPIPFSFVPVAGDELDGSASVPVAKTLEQMSGQELRDRRADLMGFSADHPQRTHTAKFPRKADLIAEIHRLEALNRPMSADSLDVSVPVVLEPEPAPAPTVADAGSEVSVKPPRKSAWDSYTPEQKAERLAKMRAARDAKRLAAVATEATETASATV